MNYRTELIKTLAALDQGQLDQLLALIRDCEGTIWLAGNGGSASTAQHWACDLSKAAGRRAIALGSNPAVLTAWANDEDYSQALAAEFRALYRPGDVLIALSCSGTSPNVLAVLNEANIQLDVKCALVTGRLQFFDVLIDALVNVPHAHYGIIEDCHLSIGHWLTEELKRELC